MEVILESIRQLDKPRTNDFASLNAPWPVSNEDNFLFFSLVRSIPFWGSNKGAAPIPKENINLPHPPSDPHRTYIFDHNLDKTHTPLPTSRKKQSGQISMCVFVKVKSLFAQKFHTHSRWLFCFPEWVCRVTRDHWAVYVTHLWRDTVVKNMTH